MALTRKVSSHLFCIPKISGQAGEFPKGFTYES